MNRRIDARPYTPRVDHKVSRRGFLQKAAVGGGALGLAALRLIRPEGARIARAEDFVTSDVAFFGIPGRAINVEHPRGIFHSDMGPFDMILAESGSMLVEPDFPAQTVNESGGHIQYISPQNMKSFDTPDMDGRASGNILLPEGGFVVGSFQDGKLWFKWRGGTVDIVVPQVENRNTIVFIRGYYGDGRQGTDQNQLVHVEGVVPDANLFMKYPNGGFISSEHAKQLFRTSHTSKTLNGGNATNCGDGGCKELLVITFDTNTGGAVAGLQREVDGSFEILVNNTDKQ